MSDAEGQCSPQVWQLKRNCAISPRQFLMFYCSLVVVCLSIAAMWMALGAWTVLPFTGFELLFVGAAFLVFARHATDYECIVISPDRLVIDSADGPRVTHVELNPRWVRIGLQDQPRPKIEIRYAGNVVLVGTHVPMHRRALIAGEMRRCIARLP